MEIAFIGLGRMGRPMALNLIRSGAALTVMSASGRHHDEFAALGARTVSNAAALGGAAIVFLCLPDGDTVRRVALGDAGLHTALKPGSLVVDTSTTAPHVAIEIAAALARAGIGFVDAPVSGMESRAVDATLTAMCGASDHHFGVVEPWLRRMASTVLHMGPVGSGQLAKLVNQLLFNINCAALAEVLPMAVKLGVDPEKIGTVINSGTGRSHASEFFVPRMLRGHFGDGYPMRKAYKDLVTGAELGAREAIPMPVLAAATSTYQTALAQGFGELDKGAMIRVFETLLDVRFHSATHGTPTPKDIPP
jgi:3-hydroxyisobutyrate dehydrogenase-like beta-hydroxyacid dehydrogenase